MKRSKLINKIASELKKHHGLKTKKVDIRKFIGDVILLAESLGMMPPAYAKETLENSAVIDEVDKLTGIVKFKTSTRYVVKPINEWEPEDEKLF